MVVVGGRNSANTKELTRLCEIAGKTAIQIETVRDLDERRRSRAREVVGVTGGTSTPIEDLHAVAERILGWRARRSTANAAAMADAAFAGRGQPAGRSTSLDEKGSDTAPLAGAAS